MKIFHQLWSQMQKFLKKNVGHLIYFPLKFLLKLFQPRNKGLFILLKKIVHWL